MTLFLLRRLYGLAQIADGLATLLTPFRLGAGLRVAKTLARARAARHHSN